MSKQRILIVEDEVAIRDMLNFALTSSGFLVEEASDSEEAFRKINSQLPQLFILDWMLPTSSGIDIMKRLRSDPITRDIPIIMLTSRAEEENKVKSFHFGADDYIVKPFSPRELIARIKAVLRRGSLGSDSEKLSFELLEINLNNQTICVDDNSVKVGLIEFELLCFLMRHPNRIYSREQLLMRVWGCDTVVDDRTVDATIKRLRQALQPYDYHKYIQTSRGSGYSFQTVKL